MSCFAIHLKQILLTCDENGLLGHELFAIDGCNMPSDSAKEWLGTFKELGQKRDKIKRLIEYHIEHDLSEARKYLMNDAGVLKCDKNLSKNEPIEGARNKRAKH